MNLIDTHDMKIPTDENGCEKEDLVNPSSRDVEDKFLLSDITPFNPQLINVTPSFISLYSIITRLRNDMIDLQPDFQRNSGVWKRRAKTRLIESLMIKLPLPAFYFDTTNDERWVVIDGLQRLSVIKEFVVDNAWPLRACDLEFIGPVCGGKRYDELPLGLQANINEAQIMICRILAGTPSRVKFDIFRRINTGGQPLNPQEIRNALNIGAITKLLKEMAASESFINATNNGFDSKRMVDRECVLRFLAFYESNPFDYQQIDFDRFLNDYMMAFNRDNSDPLSGRSSEHINDLKDEFNRAMDLAVDIFGEYAFRKRFDETPIRYPLNKALFEAWSVNLALLGEGEKEIVRNRAVDVRKRFIKLMCDDDFFESITQSTASVAKVRRRFTAIRDLLREVIKYA